jgi:hypothetical protein
MGEPQNHSFIDGFSTINHPAIGVPPFEETSIYRICIIYIYSKYIYYIYIEPVVYEYRNMMHQTVQINDHCVTCCLCLSYFH